MSGWSVYWWNWDVKVSNIIVLLLTSPLMAIRICLIYLGAPMLGAYIVIFYVTSSSWIEKFCSFEKNETC